MTWSWWMVLILCSWAGALWWNRQGVTEQDGSGDETAGVVIFVEPVRWLFVIWGFRGFCRGLRRAECEHRVELFRWSGPAGALLVVPDLIGQRRLTKSAQRLARRIEELANAHPDRPIHLVGYSSGTYVALEACRLTACPQRIGTVVLLASSVSSAYPLASLPSTIAALHSYYSPLDWIAGLGPLLFGTNDRQWSAGAGTAGFRDPPDFLRQHRWRLEDMKLGYFGDHFTITSTGFVARRVAPFLKMQ